MTMQLMIFGAMVMGVAAVAFAESGGAATQPAKADWEREADARIEKIRKGDFSVTVTDAAGEAVANADVTIELNKHAFYFGTAIAGDPTSERERDQRYWAFVAEHFNSVVCENDMKWYATEKEKGKLTYERADRQMKWAEDNGVAMRGHTLFWAKKKWNLPWVQELNEEELRAKIDERIERIVPRYKGKLIGWDVNNEMRSGTFFKDRLGEEIRAHIFKKAGTLDPDTPLFVNDYSIFGDKKNTQIMVDQVKWLQKRGAPVGGIGIQEHGSQRIFIRGKAETGKHAQVEIPDAAVTPEQIIETLDELGQFGLPIHITEVSAKTKDVERRGEALYTLLKLCFSHEDVEAFLLWGFWSKRHWLGGEAGLVEGNDLKLNAAGERIFHDLWRDQWHTKVTVKTDANGVAALRGFFGTYRVTAGDRKGMVELRKDGAGAVVKLVNVGGRE